MGDRYEYRHPKGVIVKLNAEKRGKTNKSLLVTGQFYSGGDKLFDIIEFRPIIWHNHSGTIDYALRWFRESKTSIAKSAQIVCGLFSHFCCWGKFFAAFVPGTKASKVKWKQSWTPHKLFLLIKCIGFGQVWELFSQLAKKQNRISILLATHLSLVVRSE